MARLLLLSLPDDYDAGQLIHALHADAVRQDCVIKGQFRPQYDALFVRRQQLPAVPPASTRPTEAAKPLRSGFLGRLLSGGTPS
jgi:hypothetical protein